MERQNQNEDLLQLILTRERIEQHWSFLVVIFKGTLKAKCKTCIWYKKNMGPECQTYLYYTESVTAVAVGCLTSFSRYCNATLPPV